jgi:lysophospholipase L1-like esterase
MWTSLRQDFPNLNVMNRGFGGSRLDDLVFFAPKIVAPYKPKMIVVYSGENDIEAKDPAENALEDFKAFIAFRDKTLPKTPIVYISMKPSILRWSLWPEMKRGNDLIRTEIARHKNVRFVDISAGMLGPNGEKPPADIFVADGLHLNTKGYAIITKALKPILK